METLETTVDDIPRIPGYATSRRLGRGGSSTVWLVTRNKDGARFAVKCFGARAADGPALAPAPAQVLEHVSREVGILSGLKHEHLVRVHGVLRLEGVSGDAFGIVMDYAAGGTLSNLMSGRGRLRVGEAVTILTPLAQALEYLHGTGTVHGDVSPGNILFTAEGMPLLADLGIASSVGEAQENLNLGTPGFTDPACIASGNEDPARRELVPQRDVYSLAAVGWYCLTGTAPEPEQHRPPLSLLVPEVPNALAAVLEAGLDPDPRLRPSARELGTAIFRSAAAEALDLSGAVHVSVIPELLTRRQTLGRAPRRTARWFGPRRIALSRTPKPGQWWQGRQRPQPRGGPKGVGIRAGLLMLVAVVIGAVSWATWQQDQAPSAISNQAPTESPAASPGIAADLPHSGDLPAGLAQELRSEDPAAALAALSAVRDVALGQGRLELLAMINVPGSPAEAADNELANHLREADTVFAGLLTTLSGVTVEGSPQTDDVMVGLRAATSGYEERKASGILVSAQDAGTPQELRVHLVRAEGRWRISDILGPAAAG